MAIAFPRREYFEILYGLKIWWIFGYGIVRVRNSINTVGKIMLEVRTALDYWSVFNRVNVTVGRYETYAQYRDIHKLPSKTTLILVNKLKTAIHRISRSAAISCAAHESIYIKPWCECSSNESKKAKENLSKIYKPLQQVVKVQNQKKQNRLYQKEVNTLNTTNQ